MENQPSKASEIIWVDDDEYYFVCPECYRNWGLGHEWEDLVFDDWKKTHSNTYEELSEHHIDCELCEYDTSKLSRQVRRGELDFDEIADVAKGDVFKLLRIKKASDIDNIERARGKDELVDELGLDEAPKTLAQKQITAQKQVFDKMDKEVKRQLDKFFQRLEAELDGIIADGYGTLLAEYETAMNRNLWQLSQSGLFAEAIGKVPVLAFAQPFLESWLRGIRISMDAERNAEILNEEIGEIEREVGSELRDHFEYMLDQSNKRIGQMYLLMLIFHHEHRKRA